MGLTKLATSLFLTLIPICVIGHGSSGSSEEKISERNIVFPNVEGYTTLVTDLHTHSVFSDGHVWPKIREQHERLNNLDRSLADVADLSKQNTQVLTDSNPIKMLKDLNSFIKRCERGFKQLNKPII